MTGSREMHPLRPSLFDVLSGAHPGLPRAATIAQLRLSILRNVNWILGTRRSCPPDPLLFPHAGTSLLAYGLPDLSTFDSNNRTDRERLALMVAQCILCFEPRLQRDTLVVKDVTVAERGPDEPGGVPPSSEPAVTAIRLQIRGFLAIEPYDEPIKLDTTISAQSGEVQVRPVD